MKIKTQNLEGTALDWAVAKAEGYEAAHYGVVRTQMRGVFGPEFSPSTDWAQGGPIIDRELISIEHEDGQWTAVDYRGKSRHTGPTALIAAMRCYVASKLSDDVDIPEELQS